MFLIYKKPTYVDHGYIDRLKKLNYTDKSPFPVTVIITRCQSKWKKGKLLKQLNRKVLQMYATKIPDSCPLKLYANILPS